MENEFDKHTNSGPCVLKQIWRCEMSPYALAFIGNELTVHFLGNQRQECRLKKDGGENVFN